MKNVSRRKILQAMGAAGVGASAGAGIVSGGGQNLPDCDPCPPGTDVLMKYEWDEANQAFEVEGCDALEFTDIRTDESGELTGVTFTSSLYFEEVRIKTGPQNDECDSLDRAEVLDDPEPKDGEYTGSINAGQIGEEDGISYIAFCSAACFQVDLVFGEPIEDLGNDDGGFYGARKLVHLWGDTQTGRLSGTQALTETMDGCTVSTESISADLETDTASVSFDVVDAPADGCTLTLVSYVAPCPIGFTEATGDQQYLFDSETTTFSEGPSDLTVSIPTSKDIGALCAEATENAI